MNDTSPDAQTRRRRWLGVACLSLAVGMVVLDEFALKGCLGPGAALLFWLVCFLSTALAAFCALADLRAVRQRSREAQRDLMEETLHKIEHDRGARSKGGRGHEE